MLFHWFFLDINFFWPLLLNHLPLEKVQILSPNLHHPCISVDKQSLTTAAETLGSHQDECVVLPWDITGESAYLPQLLWDREGESGLGGLGTAWKGLNASVQWGWRKKVMNQWLAKSRAICIMRQQEGTADPRSVWFTQCVTCTWQNNA